MNAFTLTVYGTEFPADLCAAVQAAGGYFSRYRRTVNFRGQHGVSLVALLPGSVEVASLPCHRWQAVLTGDRGSGALERG